MRLRAGLTEFQSSSTEGDTNNEAATMSTIGIFAIESGHLMGQNDRAKLPRINEMIGPGHQVKYSLSKDGVEYFASFASKVKAVDLDSVICTDPLLLSHILKVLPDYRQAFNKNGAIKKLSMNDYHGSFITLEGFRLGR